MSEVVRQLSTKGETVKAAARSTNVKNFTLSRSLFSLKYGKILLQIIARRNSYQQ
ncbi:MAG: hypothetical protein JO297_19240 [Nitrososphaeraceae archaeon]|nr:hypothetical protein [Nitrososphaeraceae archaeon]